MQCPPFICITNRLLVVFSKELDRFESQCQELTCVASTNSLIDQVIHQETLSETLLHFSMFS